MNSMGKYNNNNRNTMEHVRSFVYIYEIYRRQTRMTFNKKFTFINHFKTKKLIDNCLHHFSIAFDCVVKESECPNIWWNVRKKNRLGQCVCPFACMHACVIKWYDCVCGVKIYCVHNRCWNHNSSPFWLVTHNE